MSFFTKLPDALASEAVSLAADAGRLALTLLVGSRVVAWWEHHKKRRELDLALAAQFQQLFGEFKAIWRLWKTPKQLPAAAGAASPQELLLRASTAEAGVEAIILKLATDRRLTRRQLVALGLFRQAYQFLRKSIVQNQPLLYGQENHLGSEANNLARNDYGLPWYHLFNQVAGDVSRIVTAPVSLRQLLRGHDSHRPPVARQARLAFANVHEVREEHWREAVKNHPAPITVRFSPTPEAAARAAIAPRATG